MRNRNARRRGTMPSAARARTGSSASRKPAKKKSTRGRWIAAALVIGGLAFAAGWNPPSDTGVHKFTEASDYSEKRETGCTNSGEGCHGDDDRRVDFNAYHPETECKTCHEYTGVGCIPCHGPQQHECSGCHDGSMEGAGDASRLTDAYPKGHYRDTLHTAMGTDMDQVVRTVADGKAKAACGDCHSRDLAVAHTGVPEVEDSDYGTDIGCAECHNDKKSGALDQVKKDWKKHRCEDCHGEKSTAPMHAADVASKIEADDPAGCGSTGEGCHQSTDLHAMHANEPITCAGRAADGEPGCHDLGVESHVPTVTACGVGDGTCHADYENTEYGHEQDASVHVPGSNAQRGAVWIDAMTGVETTCGSCHSTDLGVEHNRGHSPIAGDACLGCHNANATTIAAVKDSWPARDTSSACASCHGTSKHGGVGSAHTATEYDNDGTAKPGACVDSGCHTSTDLRVLHAAVGCTMTGCHAASGSISGSGIQSCGGTADMADTNCHAGGVHKDIEIGHDATQLDAAGKPSSTSCVRSGCHASADVRVLHTATGDCQTAGCHIGDGPAYMSCGGPAGSAGACHAGVSNWHNGLVTAHIGTEINSSGTAEPGVCTGSGCHATVDLYALHNDPGCNIADCHDTDGPSGATGCGGPNGTAGSCHTGGASWHYAFADTHVGIELDASGTPDPGACTAALCHETVSLYTLHRETGCAIPGCHGANSTASCGGAAGTPNACHTGDSFTDSWHDDYQSSHVGIELGSTGVAQPGACTGTGCHATVSLYTLHQATGCNLPGCHGAPSIVSCGGPLGTAASCHTPPPPTTCLVPDVPTSQVVTQELAPWRTTHADGTSAGEDDAASDGSIERLDRYPTERRTIRTPRKNESTPTAPPEPVDERDAPAEPEKPARERVPGPDCTEEGSITIEANSVCLECHELRK